MYFPGDAALKGRRNTKQTLRRIVHGVLKCRRNEHGAGLG